MSCRVKNDSKTEKYLSNPSGWLLLMVGTVCSLRAGKFAKGILGLGLRLWTCWESRADRNWKWGCLDWGISARKEEERACSLAKRGMTGYDIFNFLLILT
jgi:hypothetical protein